ncbi:MAG TPA: methyltransferase domain-containing protein [Solirubrobacteraceae bacterium]|nr:methyltransferase domain-containing protein [Solirubrobacteraceae bacterium]
MRPLRAGIRALLRAVPALRAPVETLLWRSFYELTSRRGNESSVTLLNYGYAAPGETTPGEGEDELGMALYAAVAGAGELAGKQALEVGCGRGGGSAFVFERFQPSSLTAVDLAGTAIERCRQSHGRPGLTFRTGDAQRLPFAADAFDAVINVESSHCYSDMPRFLGEVHRVLRPGGLFLFADFRPTHPSPEDPFPRDIEVLRRQLGEAGLRTVEEQDITAEVLRARSLATPAVRARVDPRMPKPLRRYAYEYWGIEDTTIFRAFADGSVTYLRFVLENA